MISCVDLRAMRSLRPDTGLMLEILCTQEASEIKKIGQQYEIMFKRSLVEDIEKECVLTAAHLLF